MVHQVVVAVVAQVAEGGNMIVTLKPGKHCNGMFWSAGSQTYYLEVIDIKQLDRLIDLLKEEKEREIKRKQQFFDQTHQLTLNFE